MSTIIIHGVKQTAQRLARTAQIAAGAPFPSRHDGDHWRLNRTPFLRPSPAGSVRLAGPGTVRSPAIKQCALGMPLKPPPKGSGYNQLVPIRIVDGTAGFAGDPDAESQTIGYPHILKKITMTLSAQVLEGPGLNLTLSNSSYGAIFNNFALGALQDPAASGQTVEYTPNILVDEAGSVYSASVNAATPEDFDILLLLERLAPSDPCLKILKPPPLEGGPPIEAVEDFADEWVALSNEFLTVSAGIRFGWVPA